MAPKRFFAAAAAALMLAVPVAAIAQGQPRTIEVKAEEPFRHAHTKIELPPRLGGVARSRVLDLDQDQLDAVVDYAAENGDETYTVYIYRNVAAALPVWFDRARFMIEHRDVYGHAAGGQPVAFVPPGRKEAAGLAASYDLTGSAFRSTAVALVPAGEWYVKLRASSKSKTGAELLAATKAALGELRWPRSLAEAAPAVPIADCAAALALKGEAKPVASGGKDGGNVVIDALIGGAMMNALREKAKPAEHPAVWCRDPAQTLQTGVYRADNATDSYLLALGDAGRAILAIPDPGRIIVALQDRKPEKPSYVIELLLLSQNLTTRPYDRLPRPEEALAIVKDGRFASAFPTWGKAKGNVQINSGSLK